MDDCRGFVVVSTIIGLRSGLRYSTTSCSVWSSGSSRLDGFCVLFCEEGYYCWRFFFGNSLLVFSMTRERILEWTRQDYGWHIVWLQLAQAPRQRLGLVWLPPGYSQPSNYVHDCLRHPRHSVWPAVPSNTLEAALHHSMLPFRLLPCPSSFLRYSFQRPIDRPVPFHTLIGLRYRSPFAWCTV